MYKLLNSGPNLKLNINIIYKNRTVSQHYGSEALNFNDSFKLYI